MDVGLKGKTAIVTGGSRGIGLAIAAQLIAEGCNVLITARRSEQLSAAAAQLRQNARDSTIATYVADAADGEQAEGCVQACLDEFAGIDILVNNAATSPHLGPLVDLDRERASEITQLNQWAPLRWIQLVWKASMAERGGAIVNIASLGGLDAQPRTGYYNVSKAALIHLTRQFAVELAPRVRVNAVAPGLIRTDMAADWMSGHDESRFTRGVPLKRIGEPSDVASTAVFLLSEQAGWITGQTIVVDGGTLLSHRGS